MTMDRFPEEPFPSDDAETCVICMGFTDTGLAFHGQPAWTVYGLNLLGVRKYEALEIVSGRFGCEPDFYDLPDEIVTSAVMVCSECVTKANVPGFPAPRLMVTGD